MNLTEAIKSGRPFRRGPKRTWLVFKMYDGSFRDAYEESELIFSSVTTDMILDDWEIQMEDGSTVSDINDFKAGRPKPSVRRLRMPGKG